MNGDAAYRYTIDQLRKYGEGGYGSTFAARDTHTGEDLAVKVIDTRRMRVDQILRETQMMAMMNHTNVIQVVTHGQGSDNPAHAHLYFIFMELATGGELFDQVINSGAMHEMVAKNYFRQLLLGIAHCHMKGVAHRDIKLENVLLTAGRAVKVIDFGLAHAYPIDADGKPDRSSKLTTVCGSRSYAAPQVMNEHLGYDGFAADVWSLGVCLFAMLSGFFPVDEATDKDWRFVKLAQAQASGEPTTRTIYSFYHRSCSHLSPAAISILDGMLTIDESRRLTVEQALAHPWLSQAPPIHTEVSAANDSPVVFRSLGDVCAGGSVATYVDDMDDMDAPVYRSVGGTSAASASEAPPVPGLARQAAFGRAASALRIF